MGTDLTYGDLDLMQEVVNWTEQDATADLRGTETIEGVSTYAIAFVPKHDVGYNKIVAWLGTDGLEPRQIEFFADGAAPVKRLRQSSFRQIGTPPVAHTVEVETLAAGSRTTMQLVDVKFDQGLRDDLFSQAALERGDR